LIRSALVLCFILYLSACDRPPEISAPPVQRHPVLGVNPGPDALMIEMNDPDAGLRIVKDIYPQSDPSWRWTAQDPTVKMLLLATDKLKFGADFAIWDDGFKTTGPVEITYLVNNRPLDTVRYETPGVKHFEKPVPVDWLGVDSETMIAMHMDKVYVAPKDGMKFGVILVRMGFKAQ
jgi:hypothetical protein